MGRAARVRRGAAQSIGSWCFAALYSLCIFRKKIRERYHTEPVAPNTRDVWRFLRTGAPSGYRT